MSASSSKHRNFLALFLFLIHISPVFISPGFGMDAPIEIKSKSTPILPQATQTCSFMDGVAALEKGDFTKAITIWNKARENGSIFAAACLQSMQKDRQNNIPKDNRPFVEPLPQDIAPFAQKILKAYPCYHKYTEAKSESNKQLRVVKDLITMVVNTKNTYALSLLMRIFTGNEEKWLNTLKANKTSFNFKPLKSLEQFYKDFTPPPLVPVEFWDCLDPHSLVFFNKTKKFGILPEDEIKYFSEQYKTGAPIDQITKHLIQTSRHPFWAHLAVENGVNEGCLVLADFFSQQLPHPAPTTLQENQKNCLDYFRYYLSQIQTFCEKDKKIYAHIVAKNGDYWYFFNKNLKKARFCYQKAADEGHKEAQFEFGWMCNRGIGGTEDLPQALKYFKMSAKQGDTRAQTNCYIMHKEGRGCKKDNSKALKYLMMGVERKEKIAEFHYASLCHRGEGVPQDFNLALKFYLKSAEKGNPEALGNIGLMLENGEGCEKDLLTAYGYYEQAAEKGDKLGLIKCALRFCRGGKELSPTIEKHFMKAQDPDRLYAYGDVCYFGKRNIEEASKYYKLSADLGNAFGQINYARICAKKLDFLEAFKYCHMAVQQGEIDAILLWHAIEIDYQNYQLYSLKTSTDKDKKDVTEEPNSEATVLITLPALEVTEGSSDDMEISTAPVQETQATFPQVLLQEEEQQKPPVVRELLNQEIETERKRQEELEQYKQENKKIHAELRAKKQLQKEAAARTRHTLRVNKKDYDATCTNFVMKLDSPKEQKKSTVKYETLEFVKTIYGQGIKKINFFRGIEAQKAFADLGCIVKNKSGENSTSLIFNLGEGRVMKFKYHNPHGYGDDNLYNDLKPHMLRFLIFINKTPETLQAE